MKELFFTGLLLLHGLFSETGSKAGTANEQPLLVRRCKDFEPTGSGDHPEWNKARWHTLQKLDSAGVNYKTAFRILYSTTGLYVFFVAEDNRISTSYNEDFGDLFKGDVVEVFLHPKPEAPFYFEYEVNPLNKELVLLIANQRQSFHTWRPWRYSGSLTVKKRVAIDGGKGETGAAIKSWSAELFFPFALLRTFSNVPPSRGTVWNANFYRLDYDSDAMVKWAWQPVKNSFHEYSRFGRIQFE